MGYDTSAKTIMIFVICLNVSLYFITASQVLPVSFVDEDNPDSFVTDPQNISTKFLYVDFSTGTIFLAGTGLIFSVIIGWATRSLVLGGTLGVGIFALTLFSPVVSWILFGLPRFMNMMGIPSYISAGVMAILVVPFFFTVLSFIAQRPIEGHG